MRQLMFVLILLLQGVSARASVELRWSPADTTVTPSHVARLSVMVDEPLDLRTIELRISYAPELLLSLDGHPGELFDSSGCTLFPDFDDSTPGEWYGGVAALGANCWVTGPGELYVWEFRALADGVSPIVTLMVRLYDPDANVIADVTLPGTTVTVGDGTPAPPPAAPGLELGIAPNPFNPRCRLSLGTSSPGPARLELYDLSGRRLAMPWQGVLGEGIRSLDWTAVDDVGRPLPSGIYLLRLTDAAGAQLTRKAALVQ